MLLLDPGWLEGITINTIEPSPIGEGSRDGKLVLELGHIPAGATYLLFIQAQVNPTNIGHRSQDVALYDGARSSPTSARDYGVSLEMDIVLRALVVYLFVLVLTRAVGGRELGALEPFDLILLVMIGDLVQQGVTQTTSGHWLVFSQPARSLC